MGFESIALLIVVVIAVASVLNMYKRFQDDDSGHRDRGNDHYDGGAWHCEPTDAAEPCIDGAGSEATERPPESSGAEEKRAEAASPGYPYATCRPCEEKTTWDGQRYFEGSDGSRVEEKTSWDGTRYYEDGDGNRVEEKTDWEGNRYFE